MTDAPKLPSDYPALRSWLRNHLRPDDDPVVPELRSLLARFDNTELLRWSNMESRLQLVETWLGVVDAADLMKRISALEANTSAPCGQAVANDFRMNAFEIAALIAAAHGEDDREAKDRYDAKFMSFVHDMVVDQGDELDKRISALESKNRSLEEQLAYLRGGVVRHEPVVGPSPDDRCGYCGHEREFHVEGFGHVDENMNRDCMAFVEPRQQKEAPFRDLPVGPEWGEPQVPDDRCVEPADQHRHPAKAFIASPGLPPMEARFAATRGTGVCVCGHPESEHADKSGHGCQREVSSDGRLCDCIEFRDRGNSA